MKLFLFYFNKGKRQSVQLPVVFLYQYFKLGINF